MIDTDKLFAAYNTKRQRENEDPEAYPSFVYNAKGDYFKCDHTGVFFRGGVLDDDSPDEVASFLSMVCRVKVTDATVSHLKKVREAVDFSTKIL
jgi:hypothetical protein